MGRNWDYSNASFFVTITFTLIIIFHIANEGFLNLLFGHEFQEYLGERHDNESQPEDDDFCNEDFSSVLLNTRTGFSIGIETSSMSNHVSSNTKQGIELEQIPERDEIHSKEDCNHEDGESEILHQMVST